VVGRVCCQRAGGGGGDELQGRVAALIRLVPQTPTPHGKDHSGGSAEGMEKDITDIN
jgi:hypothetical protein